MLDCSIVQCPQVFLSITHPSLHLTILRMSFPSSCHRLLLSPLFISFHFSSSLSATRHSEDTWLLDPSAVGLTYRSPDGAQAGTISLLAVSRCDGVVSWRVDPFACLKEMQYRAPCAWLLKNVSCGFCHYLPLVRESTSLLMVGRGSHSLPLWWTSLGRHLCCCELAG